MNFIFFLNITMPKYKSKKSRRKQPYIKKTIDKELSNKEKVKMFKHLYLYADKSLADVFAILNIVYVDDPNDDRWKQDSFPVLKATEVSTGWNIMTLENGRIPEYWIEHEYLKFPPVPKDKYTSSHSNLPYKIYINNLVKECCELYLDNYNGCAVVLDSPVGLTHKTLKPLFGDNIYAVSTDEKILKKIPTAYVGSMLSHLYIHEYKKGSIQCFAGDYCCTYYGRQGSGSSIYDLAILFDRKLLDPNGAIIWLTFSLRSKGGDNKFIIHNDLVMLASKNNYTITFTETEQPGTYNKTMYSMIIYVTGL
jgi:hypothetical protein